MTLVAGYIRVSTPYQANEGESLNTQSNSIMKFAKDKGWDVLSIYADEGISGAKSKNRPGLQQLLSAAENKEFDHVIISHLSRFGRNARELLNNIHFLQNVNCKS